MSVGAGAKDEETTKGPGREDDTRERGSSGASSSSSSSSSRLQNASQNFIEGPKNVFGFSALNELASKAKDMLAPDATSSAPPPVAKDSTMDPLEAILAWHLGSSTSTTLTSQEVSDTIVSEVTSFPANKLVRGQSPSVAMHLPIPFIRAHERKFRGRKELVMGRNTVMEKEIMTGNGMREIDIDDSNAP